MMNTIRITICIILIIIMSYISGVKLPFLFYVSTPTVCRPAYNLIYLITRFHLIDSNPFFLIDLGRLGSAAVGPPPEAWRNIA